MFRKSRHWFFSSCPEPESFYPRGRDVALKSPDAWLKLKGQDDRIPEQLWRIHNGLYDLDKFIDKHPGKYSQSFENISDQERFLSRSFWNITDRLKHFGLCYVISSVLGTTCGRCQAGLEISRGSAGLKKKGRYSTKIPFPVCHFCRVWMARSWQK